MWLGLFFIACLPTFLNEVSQNLARVGFLLLIEADACSYIANLVSEVLNNHMAVDAEE